MTWQPRNHPVAAIAFDCDGLLVDTETCWTQAEAMILARYGLEFTPEIKARFIGTTIDWTVARMAEWFDRVGQEAEIKAELTQTVAVVIAEQAEAMPGAVELVRAVHGRVPIAVVSNSERQLVELALRHGGLADAFDTIVPAEAVAHGKPAPDLYLKACELLRVEPARTLAFEDSLVGVNAAKAAGVTVVGVPTVPQDGFVPDHLLSSLADPDLLAWAQGLNA